ncbi:hypothetical protein GpartN1_g1945.t1 [Galdieria partita]|uniref:Resolvase/invertase-type recombinase catalytic domain-containing protein n=1 Tax=Galdieria partita TaxID=83374 RepID=A0A9C7PTI2_9RHOD|nr:hypothetical protein GpartN1_g1945.t1 [Galdieria partita]
MNSTEIQKIHAYCRISTNEYKQSFERQEEVISRYLEEHYKDIPRETHKECISGVKEKRPFLEKIVNDLKPGDLFVVSDLDRIARSVFHLLTISKKIEENGAFLLVVNRPELNTATPSGKFMFTLLSAVAEFEHSIILQRAQEGLRAARLRGVKAGPSRRLKPRAILKIAEEMKNPSTVVAELARVHGVSAGTIYRYVHNDGTLTEKGFDVVREEYPNFKRETSAAGMKQPTRRHKKEDLSHLPKKAKKQKTPKTLSIS